MKRSLVFFVLILLAGKTFPQACCSAGSPLLSSLEYSSSQKGFLKFGLTYEYNFLDAVYSGTTDINDDTRLRRVHSILLETSYGFTSKFSVTSLLTFINQRREISSFSESQNQLSTIGISDAVVLLKYNLMPLTLSNQNELSFGAGVKIPLGKSTLRDNGILLPADMQPGTGAWDYIFSLYASKGFMPKIPLNIFINSSYRLNGTNRRFGDRFEGYSFGNEFIASIGFGYRTNTPFDFSLSFRYRSTRPDKFNNEDVSNTGGKWFYVIPGINARLGHNLTTRISGSLPLYRNLTGTQLTTTYTSGLTIFYTIDNL